MSETKEPKIARKGVLVALGIICIILVACLGGVVAAYTLMINDKSNTISSLTYQISQLNSSITNLQNQVASANSTINSLAFQVTNLQNQLDLNVLPSRSLMLFLRVLGCEGNRATPLIRPCLISLMK